MQYRFWPQECCNVTLHVKLYRHNVPDSSQLNRNRADCVDQKDIPELASPLISKNLAEGFLIFLYFSNSKHLTFSTQ